MKYLAINILMFISSFQVGYGCKDYNKVIIIIKFKSSHFVLPP
jgi:hypothetical protein